MDVSSETTKLKKATYSDETLLYTIDKVLEVKNSLLEERELKFGEINNRKQIKKVLLKQLIHPQTIFIPLKKNNKEQIPLQNKFGTIG